MRWTLLAALTLPVAVSVLDAQKPIAPEFAAAPCAFMSPERAAARRVECGVITVAESDRPDAPRFRLRIAILRALGESRHGDAIVLIPGGPGGGFVRQNAARLAEHPLQDSLRRHRDIVLFDPRGTGDSEPHVCPQLSTLESRAVIFRTSRRESTEIVRRQLGICRAELDSAGVSAAHLGSVASARDLEAIRVALGYDALNLIGISYGTRVALETMRRYPASVRSAILYAPLPPDAPWSVDRPARNAASLTSLFAQCASDAACADRFPALEQTYRDAIAQLEKAPVSIRGPLGAVRVDGRAAATLVAYALYDSDFLPYIPLAIERLRAREVGFVERFLPAALGGDLNAGVYFAARCTELPPGVDTDSVQRVRDSYPLVGSVDQLEPELTEVCDVLATPRADDSVFEPVTSAVPTLVFVGELDPATPPDYGRQLARTVPARVMVLRGRGHDVNVPTPCTVGLRADFLEDPTAPLDTSCVVAMPPLRFATAVHVNAGVARVATRMLGERRIAWMALATLLLLSLLAALVLLPSARRTRDPSAGRAPALTSTSLWLAAAGAMLLSLAIGAAIVTTNDPYVLAFGVPEGWAPALALAPLVMLLGVLGAVGALVGSQRAWWTKGGRAMHLLSAAACLAFIAAVVLLDIV